MKITGRRADGALYLSVGGGFAVILKGTRVTPTVDATVIEALGPWLPADNTFEARRAAQKALDLASMDSVDAFDLKKQSDWFKKFMASKVKTPAAPTDGAPVVGTPGDSAPVEGTPGEEATESPAEEATEPPSEDAKKGKAKQLAAPAVGPSTTGASGTTMLTPSLKFSTLLASTTKAKHLSAGGEHPFTYCKDTVIPAMAKDGKEPDDADAFCAWWKNEGPGAE